MDDCTLTWEREFPPPYQQCNSHTSTIIYINENTYNKSTLPQNFQLTISDQLPCITTVAFPDARTKLSRILFCVSTSAPLGIKSKK